MVDQRRKNEAWQLPERDFQWEHAEMAVLMDIRDELQRLNRLLHCSNFIAMPQLLRSIQRNTYNLPKKPVRKKEPSHDHDRD